MPELTIEAYRCDVCGCIDVRYGVHFASEYVIDAPGFEGDICFGEPTPGRWTSNKDDEEIPSA